MILGFQEQSPFRSVGSTGKLQERIVLLKDRPDPHLVVEAFRLGARGVFSRSESDLGSLCKCVYRVYHGQIWANNRQLEYVMEALAQMPSVPTIRGNGSHLLSKREEDVAHLVSEGLSNREIAEQLHVSEHTVKNYLFHIFDKLGVSNRVELVLYVSANPRKAAARSGAADKHPAPRDASLRS